MAKNVEVSGADPWIEPLDFTAFAVRTTGLMVSETKLNIDEYTLHAAFYKASTSRLLLLVALTKHEVALFRKFEGSFAGITMAFQQPGMRRPLRIFARCTITRIAEMTQREGISMIETEIKPIPGDYMRILEEYRTLLSCLKDDYDRYANQSIRMAPRFARLLGFNNHAVLHAYGNRFELAVVSIASNHLEFLLQSAPPDIAPGNDNSDQAVVSGAPILCPWKIDQGRSGVSRCGPCGDGRGLFSRAHGRLCQVPRACAHARDGRGCRIDRRHDPTGISGSRPRPQPDIVAGLGVCAG